MHDDDLAVTLLRPLDTEPVTPSTIDVDRAVRDGRRRRRRRSVVRATAVAAATGLVLAGGAVTLTALRGSPTKPDTTTQSPSPSVSVAPTRNSPITTPAPTPPTECRLEQLPMPQGHRQAFVFGADPTGRYVVGRSEESNGTKHLLMWRDGQLQRLQIKGKDPALTGVNSAGTAVGYRVDTSEPVPFVYRDNKETKLAPRGQAQAINEAGTIVGAEGGRVPAEMKPVRWATADSAPEPLPLPAGFTNGVAVDIDEDGTIVGLLARDDRQVPYVWFPDGTHRELAPRGTTRFGMVARIRNGWVVGSVQPDSAPFVEMRWNVNTGKDTTLDDLVDGGAHAVNAHGWVTAQHTSGNAVMITPAGFVQLPGLPGVTGFLSASWLSDDGRTAVGTAMNTSSWMRPVVWRCS